MGDSSLNELRRLKFIVDDSYNKDEVISNIASKESIKSPFPSLSYIMLTDNCNFRCKYCYIENALKDTGHILTKEMADKVINVIVNNSKDKKEYKIVFYGGEPTLNIETMKHIVERLSKIDKKKFRFSMVTNGSNVTDELARYMKENNFSAGLSIDGWYELDKERVYANGKSTFYDALRALAILKKDGVNLSISCTVTKYNYMYLEEIVDFFKKLGVGGIGFNIILDETNKEYAVENPKQLAYYLFKAFKRATELGVFEDRIGRRRADPFFKETPRFYDCPAYGQQIFFSPKGTLGPCQAFYTTSLYQERISEDFDARKSKVMYEWINMGSPISNKECSNCPALGICGGACAYDVYTKTGKLGIIDPYYCTFVKEVLRYLIKYYYETEVKKISVARLSPEHLKQLEGLIEALKHDPDNLMHVEKITDVRAWVGANIMAAENNRGVFYVAKDNLKNSVVGFCNIVENDGKYVIGVAVAKEYREKGIGKTLVKEALKSSPSKEVYAMVDAKNEPAIRLSLGVGFKLYKREGERLTYKIEL